MTNGRISLKLVLLLVGRHDEKAPVNGKERTNVSSGKRADCPRTPANAAESGRDKFYYIRADCLKFNHHCEQRKGMSHQMVETFLEKKKEISEAESGPSNQTKPL